RPVVRDDAVRLPPVPRHGLVADAAGADHELPDPVAGDLLVRLLRREALVVVVMAVEHDLRTRRGEVLPERRVLGITPVAPGGEPRRVPVGERAGRGVRGEVLAEPRFLGRALAASAHELAR